MKTPLSGVGSYFGSLKRLLAATPTPDPVWAKDVDICASLRRFMNESDDLVHAPRETELLPEILIPCFNHGRYLRQALQSVAGFVMPVTINNDLSTDDTPKHLADLRERFEFNLIENTSNLLQWGSLNKAVAVSENSLFHRAQRRRRLSAICPGRDSAGIRRAH